MLNCEIPNLPREFWQAAFLMDLLMRHGLNQVFEPEVKANALLIEKEYLRFATWKKKAGHVKL